MTALQKGGMRRMGSLQWLTADFWVADVNGLGSIFIKGRDIESRFQSAEMSRSNFVTKF